MWFAVDTVFVLCASQSSTEQQSAGGLCYPSFPVTMDRQQETEEDSSRVAGCSKRDFDRVDGVSLTFEGISSWVPNLGLGGEDGGEQKNARRQVLFDITAGVRAQEVLALMGPSGSTHSAPSRCYILCSTDALHVEPPPPPA